MHVAYAVVIVYPYRVCIEQPDLRLSLLIARLALMTSYFHSTPFFGRREAARIFLRRRIEVGVISISSS